MPPWGPQGGKGDGGDSTRFHMALNTWQTGVQPSVKWAKSSYNSCFAHDFVCHCFFLIFSVSRKRLSSPCPNLPLSASVCVSWQRQTHPEVNAFFCCCACLFLLRASWRGTSAGQHFVLFSFVRFSRWRGGQSGESSSNITEGIPFQRYARYVPLQSKAFLCVPTAECLCFTV